jgi:hypothetical protein
VGSKLFLSPVRVLSPKLLTNKMHPSAAQLRKIDKKADKNTPAIPQKQQKALYYRAFHCIKD